MASLTPLFIVGMPRSGTKLVRELLNGHPDVAVFPNESHFIPYFSRRFPTYGDITQPGNFARFFREFQHTTFHRRMAAKGLGLNEQRWFSLLDGPEYRDLLAAMFRCYGEMRGAQLVGDKTPGYITQVPLLHSLFPSAFFVHMVRDPRDYALSMRNAWGKSMLRSVQRWKTQVRRFRRDAEECHVRLREVKFEDLLDDPERTVKDLCGFLRIHFYPAMLDLQQPSENLGDARGIRAIVRSNYGKWRHALRRRQVAAMESIAGVTMSDLGYRVLYRRGDRDLGFLRMNLERCYDGINLFRFRLREEGGLGGAVSETVRATRYRAIKE